MTSNSLHPGTVVTDLFRNIPIPEYIRPFFTQLTRVALMDPDDGAKTQVYVATAPEIESVTGAYFQPMAKLAKPSALSQNVTLQKELWDYSEEAVKEFSSPIELSN